jgi:hypothetical protein
LSCPVCKVELSDKNECPKCRRVYFPINQNDIANKQKLDFDIEATSLEASPILLCSEENHDDVNNRRLSKIELERDMEQQEDKGVGYLRKKFGSSGITITSRVEYPN